MHIRNPLTSQTKQNNIGDREFWIKHLDAESRLLFVIFKPCIDVYATPVNKNFNISVAYIREPKAVYIDIFTLDSMPLLL